MGSVWDSLSPDVEAALSGGKRREQERKMTPGQRKEKKRQESRERIWGEITRCTWIRDAVEEIAETENVPAGGLVPWLIALGIRAYRNGARPHKTPTESPRYDYVVEVSEGDAGL